MPKPIDNRIKKDIAFIESNQNSWPHWPFLPLVKRVQGKGDKQFGVIVSGNRSVVWLTNLYDILQGVVQPQDCESIIYSSVEEMVMDGWMVD